MVRVCLSCGRGFTDWAAPTPVDGFAVWWTQEETGPPCGGQVMLVSRSEQTRQVNDEEFFAGQQWSPEQIETMKSNRGEADVDENENPG